MLERELTFPSATGRFLAMNHDLHKVSQSNLRHKLVKHQIAGPALSCLCPQYEWLSAGCRKEHEDAEETAKWIKDAGVKYITIPGDLADEAVCQ